MGCSFLLAGLEDSPAIHGHIQEDAAEMKNAIIVNH